MQITIDIWDCSLPLISAQMTRYIVQDNLEVLFQKYPVCASKIHLDLFIHLDPMNKMQGLGIILRGIRHDSVLEELKIIYLAVHLCVLSLYVLYSTIKVYKIYTRAKTYISIRFCRVC